MTWLLFWKLVVATAATVMLVSAITVAVSATRSAIHEWKTLRAETSK
jgi:hypothetical protein